MSIDRTIVLDNEIKANAAALVIANNWQAMARDGHPMAIRAYEYKENRTLEQQSLMWIRLGEIEAQSWIGGRQYSDVCWHEHAKRTFLPEEDGPSKRCRKGYKKWAINPMTGERVLIGSTTQLTTFGMAEYLTQLMAWGATELGVQFSATPNEMRAAA